jgi:cell division protein FtsB
MTVELGRQASKMELSILFANTYAEYVKLVNDINKGYTLYKEIEGRVDKIKEEIKDLETIPTSVITTILEEKVLQVSNQ